MPKWNSFEKTCRTAVVLQSVCFMKCVKSPNSGTDKHGFPTLLLLGF